MMHVIQQTADNESKIRRGEITWIVKSLGSVMAGLSQDKKQMESLMKAVEKMSLLDDEEVSIGDDTTSSRNDNRTLEEIMESGNVEAALAKNSRRQGPGLPFVA